MATIYKSEVWAGKVDSYYNVVTDEAVCLGKIEYRNGAEAFIKTLRLYNKNANRHLYDPQFIFRGRVYVCGQYGEPSKTGRGYTHYWVLHRTNAKSMPVTFSMYGAGEGPVKTTEQFVLSIPKSKVNSPDWRKYLEE